MLKMKAKEWLHRYIPAEILGTCVALIAAWLVYAHTHSFVLATAAGWLGEGCGFYGYFVTNELVFHARRYREHAIARRVALAVTKSTTNLFIEFMPAELVDNFFVRPLAMYSFPQFIHPYPVGFLVGKLAADGAFYAFAIVGYELRKHWMRS